MADYMVTKDCELKHYGVKGMKWGVRNDHNKKSNPVSSGRTQSKEQSEKIRKTVEKGVEKASHVMAKVGSAYVVDQVFFDGAGTEATKAAVKTIGRAAITAVAMARGGYDIKWYD